jgi:hypothetical protein
MSKKLIENPGQDLEDLQDLQDYLVYVANPVLLSKTVS